MRYEDLLPITTRGKIFTMIYGTIGSGFVTMFISLIVKAFIYSK
ncbi:ion channel [Lactococcus garvieae]|nr:ion channel [Lactococcus garvieae]MDT2741278.1 ion channel [Lactococcus garvieae]